MCGIAGYSGSYDLEMLNNMCRQIAHRGPDDFGVEILNEERIGLAHTRLSIIDLSTAGHQPLWDVERRAVITFNGELYNYRELRTELERSGFRFSSSSDTEVLLNMYIAHGENMFARLNGIFAFAIWDPIRGVMLLARDPIGVKPCYYAETSQGFVFASELKALLGVQDLSRDLDPVSIRHYLTYLWCPAPLTPLKGVRKLEPGQAMLIQNGRSIKCWYYYDVPHDPSLTLNPTEARVRVHSAVRAAVLRQMVSDVPVGAFLSGGVDSSAIVSIAREHTNGKPFRCFSIRFRDSKHDTEGMEEDEKFAKLVAKTLGVRLDWVTVGPEMIQLLDTMIWQLDEPQADLAALHTYLICKLAREQGVKVLLSGTGGDDLFGGYRRHMALMAENAWVWLPRSVRAGLRSLTSSLSTDRAFSRRIRKAFEYADLEPARRMVSYFYWLSPMMTANLLGPILNDAKSIDVAEPLLSTLARLAPGTPALDRMLHLELKHFLADHNLNYVDKMSMATAVEVRVPLLDLDLVRLAFQLPTSLKHNGRTGKLILKRAFEGHVPTAALYRRKRGFGAPLRRWLKNELREVVEESLSTSKLRSRGLFNAEAVRTLWGHTLAGRTDASYTIFSLLCIERWCQLFLDAPASQRTGRPH